MGKSGRHKKGRQGHQGAGGKRCHGSVGGGQVPRLAGGQGPAPPDLDYSASDGGGGMLHIGGMVVRVDGSCGRCSLHAGPSSISQHRRQRRRSSGGSIAVHPQKQATRDVSSGPGGNESSSAGGSSSGIEDEWHERRQAMKDYLENLAAADAADATEEAVEDVAAEDEAAQKPHASGSSGSQADAERCSSGGRGGGRGAAKRRRRGHQQYDVLRRFISFHLHDEGPVVDLGWPGMSSEGEGEEDSDSSSSGRRLCGGSGSETDDDGSSSSSDSGSSGSSSSGDGESSSEGEGDEEELMETDLQHLSLAQRFPVQVRPRPPPLPGQQQQAKQAGGGGGSKKKKHRPSVRGAKGSKLAPGEKKRLKREGMEAKRAARAAARGFDLPWINCQLEEFVLRQGDLQAFGPFGKHEGRAVARLAALYSCRASLQGSKSSRKLVLVAATPRTCLPQGAELLQIGQILAAQTAAERSGAALDSRLAAAVAGADLTSILPPSLMGAQVAGGRWAGMRRSSGGGNGGGRRDTAASGSPKSKQRSKLKPVAFVSVGNINPDVAVEMAVPTAIAASVAAEAAPAGAEAGGGDVKMDGSGKAAVPVAEFATAAPQPATDSISSSSEDEGPAVARGHAAARQEQQHVAAATAGFQLLEVVEDLGGSEPEVEVEQLLEQWQGLGAAGSEEEEEEEKEQERHAELGSTGALYTRMTARSLSAASPLSTRGSAAAEGITNPGRLLGLGLALGIGPEVFGAPGPVQAPGCRGGPSSRATAADLEADLSPLSPLLSKTQLRKMQRRASRGGTDAVSPGLGGGVGDGADGAAGQRGLMAGDYGYFERHTTGIGSKLLSKWGFGGEGTGLGRQQQGRSEPLQAVRRAKGLGLGAQT